MKLNLVIAILLLGSNWIVQAAEAHKPATNAIPFQIPNYAPRGCDEIDEGIWSLKLTPVQQRKANERCYGSELLTKIRKALGTDILAVEVLANSWQVASDNNVFPYGCNFTGEILVIAALARAKALSRPSGDNIVDSIEKAQELGQEIGACRNIIENHLVDKIWESMSPAQLKVMKDRHRR